MMTSLQIALILAANVAPLDQPGAPCVKETTRIQASAGLRGIDGTVRVRRWLPLEVELGIRVGLYEAKPIVRVGASIPLHHARDVVGRGWTSSATFFIGHSLSLGGTSSWWHGLNPLATADLTYWFEPQFGIYSFLFAGSVIADGRVLGEQRAVSILGDGGIGMGVAF